MRIIQDMEEVGNLCETSIPTNMVVLTGKRREICWLVEIKPFHIMIKTLFYILFLLLPCFAFSQNTYDENGLLKDSIVYNADSTIKLHVSYKYWENGSLKKIDNFCNMGNRYFQSIETYTKQGKLQSIFAGYYYIKSSGRAFPYIAKIYGSHSGSSNENTPFTKFEMEYFDNGEIKYEHKEKKFFKKNNTYRKYDNLPDSIKVISKKYSNNNIVISEVYQKRNKKRKYTRLYYESKALKCFDIEFKNNLKSENTSHCYYENGTIKYSSTELINDSNYKIEKKSYYLSGTLKWYFFNDQNSKIEIEYDEEGKVITEKIMKYDENGQLIIRNDKK